MASEQELFKIIR